MKYNQSFMIAYFLFIFICFWCKVFGMDFGDMQLERIISGIAIASSAFAFADFFFYWSNERKKIKKLYKKISINYKVIYVMNKVI